MLQKRQTELFCEWLGNFLDYERIREKKEFSLETMRFLVNRFKHPENAFKSIHVAGSKGKGSVTTMMACILETAGKKTGIYTSPHILDFTERISSPSGPFTDEIYGRAGDIIVPLVDSIIPGSIPGDMDPTWFELVTLFAFVTFKEAGLEWAVIETGLGGRLDATNVVHPEACVITPIELEHTEYLGNTITQIAGEKAGIIKDGIPVFISGQKPAARSVFEETAARHCVPLFSMEEAVKSIGAKVAADGLSVDISFNRLPGGAQFTRNLHTKLRLVGEIQAKNAALAAYTVKYLFPDMNEETIEEGLSHAWLPGRFEIVPGSSPIILDGAHTVQSMTLTLETFRRIYTSDAHLVFACAADKNVDLMAELFREGFSSITITRPGERKQSDISHAEAAFRHVFSDEKAAILHVDTDYATVLQEAFETAYKTGIPLLVTGSFYLVAEAKKILAHLNQDQGR